MYTGNNDYSIYFNVDCISKAIVQFKYQKMN